MRKTLVTAATALIVFGGAAQVPAWAAAPETPTDVQISWADVSAGKIQVRWTDAGTANQVVLERQGSSSTRVLATTAAGAANEVLVSKDDMFSIQRITVIAVDADGAQSAAAASPWYDTARPSTPQLTDAGPTADLSLLTVWTNPALPADTTPNDPLDRPASDTVVGPEIWYGWGHSDLVEEFMHPAGTTSALVPPRPRPYPVKIVSHNEWGLTRSNRWITFAVRSVGLTLPATAGYNQPIPVRGTATIVDCITGSAPCVPHADPNRIPVTLQTRADATKPWAYAGRYFADGGSAIEGVTRSLITQQYRFYIPIQKFLPAPGDTVDGGTVTAPASSSVRTVTVTP